MAAAVGNSVRLVLASAAGATLATNGGSERFMAALSSIFGGGSGGDISKEALLQQMQFLTEVMKTQNQGITVVTSGGSGARNVGGILILAGAGTAVAYYKGYSFGDVAWVSKAAFKVAQRNIGLGMDNLKDAVVTLRSELVGKVAEVDGKVDELHEGQEETNDRLRRMSEQVDSVALDVNKIDEVLERMQAQMEGVMNNQDYTNQGIYILCALVSQMFVVSRAGPQESLPPAVLEQRMRLLEKLNGFIANFNGAADDVNHQLLQEARKTLELTAEDPAPTPAAGRPPTVPTDPSPPAPPANRVPAKLSSMRPGRDGARVVAPEASAEATTGEAASTSSGALSWLLSSPNVSKTLRRMSSAAGPEPEVVGGSGTPVASADADDFERYMAAVEQQTNELRGA